MSELTEKDHQLMQTGRLMRAESDVMLPMLDQKRDLIISKLITHYRAGEIDRITHAAAELSVIEEMKQTIKNKIRSAEALERKVLNE